MVKFVWVKFINVHLVNRKRKACMLAGIAHSLHTEGKKNGLLFSFITPCLYEALIVTLGSFLFPLFLSPLFVMVVYWIIFIKCWVLKLIWRKSEPGTVWLPVLCILIMQQPKHCNYLGRCLGAWRLQQKVRGWSVVPAGLCSCMDLYK